MSTNPQSPSPGSRSGGAAEGSQSPSDADLKPYGWAPGGYLSKCSGCGETHDFTDKRSIHCRPCAEKLYAADRTPTHPVAEGRQSPGLARLSEHGNGCPKSVHHTFRCTCGLVRSSEDNLPAPVAPQGGGEELRLKLARWYERRFYPGSPLITPEKWAFEVADEIMAIVAATPSQEEGPK